MTRWFTSDLHMGHANIIRFCDRPFREVATMDDAIKGDLRGSVPFMNEGIVDALNTHVGYDDKLWILGDLAMGNLDEMLKICRRFVCQNITLVAGNHDRCHPYNGEKALPWIPRYTEDTGIRTLILTETTTFIGDTEVTVNHFPYAGNSHEMRDKNGNKIVDKFLPWRPKDTGGWLLCGHVHEVWRQQGRQINVGIDAWGGRPVREEEIRDMIKVGPQDLPRFMWEHTRKEGGS